MQNRDALTLDDVDSALRFVSPDNRDEWVRVGMAIKSEFGDGGFDTWDSWSKQGSTYNAATAQTVWRSFKAGGTGIGSLVFLAQENGFKFNKKDLTEQDRQRLAAEASARAVEVAARAEKDKQERARGHKFAAATAQHIWARLAVESGASDYLTRKGVRAYGVRFLEYGLVIINPDLSLDHRPKVLSGPDAVRHFFDNEAKSTASFHYHKRGTVVVPVQVDGELVNLQFISACGNKKFIKGGRKSGGLAWVHSTVPGELYAQNGGVVAIAEGYSTAASIHMATGWPVVVAFDAGNLVTVAQSVRALFPDARLVVCGDDDRDTEGNPGRTKAQAAAVQVGGVALFPEFGRAISGKDEAAA